MANGPHPDLSELTALANGSLSRSDRNRVVRHLLTGCRACASAIRPIVAAALSAEAQTIAPEGACYDAPMERAVEGARRQFAAKRVADVEVGELVKSARLPQRRFFPEFAGRVAYGEAWLAACEGLRRAAPETYEIAVQFTVTLSERLAQERLAGPRDHDRLALAWAELGNARRLRAKFQEAEECFGNALETAEQGSRDPLVLAQILDLTSSLWIAKRNFEDAEISLALAGRLYASCRRRDLVGKVLILRAAVASHTGHPDRAVALNRRALAKLDAASDGRLYRIACLNTVEALMALGDVEAAELLYRACEALLETSGGVVDRFKHRWVGARIAFARGRYHHAERILRDVRRGFVAHRLPYHVATATLDLCSIWAREGRTEELRAGVALSLETFLALGIEREALAAVILLEEAARQERATVALVEAAVQEIQTLERAGRLPAR